MKIAEKLIKENKVEEARPDKQTEKAFAMFDELDYSQMHLFFDHMEDAVQDWIDDADFEEEGGPLVKELEKFQNIMMQAAKQMKKVKNAKES